MSTRDTAFSGSFYPDNIDELDKYLNHFDSVLKKANFQIDNLVNPRAIISPHAGYIYSGFTANAAYKYIEYKTPKTIIVIGPSHRVYIDGISIAKYDSYKTPYKDLEIDTLLSKTLEDKFDFISFNPNAHQEHSTETQFPFIAHYFKDVKVVELVYGKIDYKEISKVIDYLLEDKDNFIVISTDLSHFYNQKEANTLDNICINGIKDMDLNTFDKGCEACGILGVKAMIESANKQNMKSKIIDYRTSADASGDTSRVVGYVSAIIHEIN